MALQLSAGDPDAAPLSPAQYAALHARLGPARALPPHPPNGSGVSTAAYQAYRATGTYISPGGKTVQYYVGPTPSDPVGTVRLRITATQPKPGTRSSSASALPPP